MDSLANKIQSCQSFPTPLAATCHATAQLAFDNLTQLSRQPDVWVYEARTHHLSATAPASGTSAASNPTSPAPATDSASTGREPSPLAREPAPSRCRPRRQGSVIHLCEDNTDDRPTKPLSRKVVMNRCDTDALKKVAGSFVSKLRSTGPILADSLVPGLRSIGPILADSINLSNGVVIVDLPGVKERYEDNEALWKGAMKIQSDRQRLLNIQWVLTVLAACEAICKNWIGETVKKEGKWTDTAWAGLPPNEKRSRIRCMNGILMLNKMVNRLAGRLGSMGSMSLKLYDVYASKSYNWACWLATNRCAERNGYCASHADSGDRLKIADKIADAAAGIMLKEAEDAKPQDAKPSLFYLPSAVGSVLKDEMEQVSHPNGLNVTV